MTPLFIPYQTISVFSHHVLSVIYQSNRLVYHANGAILAPIYHSVFIYQSHITHHITIHINPHINPSYINSYIKHRRDLCITNHTSVQPTAFLYQSLFYIYQSSIMIIYQIEFSYINAIYQTVYLNQSFIYQAIYFYPGSTSHYF